MIFNCLMYLVYMKYCDCKSFIAPKSSFYNAIFKKKEPKHQILYLGSV
jgi:hypothetical protein